MTSSQKCGIGQGETVRPDLLEITLNLEERSLGSVDDAMVMAEGKKFNERVDTITTDSMDRKDRDFQWVERPQLKLQDQQVSCITFDSHRSASLIQPVLAARFLFHIQHSN